MRFKEFNPVSVPTLQTNKYHDHNYRNYNLVNSYASKVLGVAVNVSCLVKVSVYSIGEYLLTGCVRWCMAGTL